MKIAAAIIALVSSIILLYQMGNLLMHLHSAYHQSRRQRLAPLLTSTRRFRSFPEGQDVSRFGQGGLVCGGVTLSTVLSPRNGRKTSGSERKIS